ncbi:TetR/AcrR family transcriptional regulator [Sphingomonas nostoxanthinifaciens]|nr:TetR/AcrR family transcriptional regulator [Sphingomonas nostoxanthinifaciens]
MICGLSSRAIERRRRVTDAARTLFCEHGFHNTAIAQIAEVSGIKVGQIYRDFDGKDAIVAEIVRGNLANLPGQDALALAIAAADPGAIRAWIAGFVGHELNPQDRYLLPEIIVEAGRNNRVAALVGSVGRCIREGLDTALMALAPGDAKADQRRAVAELILTLMIGLPLHLLAVGGLDTAETGQRFSEMVMRELDHLAA